ncbi:MAG: OmpA family protein [Planctomycetes bacterium]|nr:OmpA family protein [Planctomycetota bacterium]
MNKSKSLVLVLCCAIVISVSGCGDPQKYNDLKAQNRIQQQRIEGLENELGLCSGQLQQKTQELEGLSGKAGADQQAKDALIAALEADILKKKALIAQMQTQLLQGGTPLPAEMNVLLQDFAKNSDMVDFDAATGMLKFKSDLLFDSGSDTVKSGATEAVKALAGIMNSDEGGAFDVVIVGHTDNMPIKKAATLKNHPTNWHLSVHRAISVERMLDTNGIAPERMAVKGYGQYRPVETNKPGKKGNAANRRVEIFIIPGST